MSEKSNNVRGPSFTQPQKAEVFPESFFVIEIDGEVAGLINTEADTKPDLEDTELKDLIGHDPSKQSLVVMSVIVHKTMQRKKLATAFVKHFINQMKQQHRKEFFLLCKNKLTDFYEKLGFVFKKKGNLASKSPHWNKMWLNLAA